MSSNGITYLEAVCLRPILSDLEKVNFSKHCPDQVQNPDPTE